MVVDDSWPGLQCFEYMTTFSFDFQFQMFCPHLFVISFRKFWVSLPQPRLSHGWIGCLRVLALHQGKAFSHLTRALLPSPTTWVYLVFLCLCDGDDLSLTFAKAAGGENSPFSLSNPLARSAQGPGWFPASSDEPETTRPASPPDLKSL